MTEFTCNICGKRNRGELQLGREVASCETCGSSVRTRSVIYVLAMELFGVPLALPDFPRVKSLRGMGTSDPNQYAEGLARKFDYRDTFYDREPRFDIANPPVEELGRYDFVVSSEVFEHVPPPAVTPFHTAYRLLKPNGVLVLTVPYSVETATIEHFPEMHEFGLARVGDRMVLVNRKKDGGLEVFEDLVFHAGWGGPSLEMRQLTENGLKELLAGGGFSDVRFYGEHYPAFGIVHTETWSLPMAARKGAFAFGLDATRDLVREWQELKLKFDGEMARLDRALWFRVGRKLGLL
jgi:hypothetical protein